MKKLCALLSILMIITGFSISSGFIFAQNSPDAIAVRVLPNNEHLSASAWYKNNNFSGSPQSVKIDGYNAVRDGRTVYANIANSSNGGIWTNIYLISYNQQAEKETTDIFANVLKHWRFNSNLNSFGHCRQSGRPCLKDSECAINDYCDSLKARVTRDTRRLEDMADARIKLNSYYNSKGEFPILDSGTYITNASISVWPSWTDTLALRLGSALAKDPINRLGDCPGYNEVTCWDEETRSFFPGLPDLPETSFAYTFIGDSSGLTAEVCAVFESGLNIQGSPACAIDICIDNDNDGYGLTDSENCGNPGLLDCNDSDNTVFAGTPEQAGLNCYDGQDNDCNGLIDCFDPACQADANCSISGFCNNNGFCEPALGETCDSCPQDFCCGPDPCGDGVCDTTCECSYGASPCPADCFCGNGVQECAETCDDGNTVGGDGCSSACQRECTDSDGDRHILQNNPNYAICGNICGQFGNLSCLGYNDCNDQDSSIFYGPWEKDCSDSTDDNCQNGPFDGCEPDDSQLACLALGYDYSALRAPALRCCGDDSGEGGPYEPSEVTCDGASDNDCDGQPDSIDSDCTGICTGTEDDWFVSGSCQSVCADGLDNDTDGASDSCDSDCGLVLENVGAGDFEPTEASCDDIDNDCDGTVDESHPDKGNACTAGLGVCESSGFYICDPSDPLAPAICDAVPGLPGTEICGNAVDEDCDGNLDNGCASNTYFRDADADGYGDPYDSQISTVQPSGYVLDNTDCDDTDGNINPGMSEICNGIDDDCQNGADDGLTAPLYSGYGVCDGTPMTCGGESGWYLDYGDVPDYLSPEEGTGNCDGLDNDCDNVVEDCAAVCQASEYIPGSDLCGDGIDNNCDGSTDCDDASCAGNSPYCPVYCTFDTTLPCVFP